MPKMKTNSSAKKRFKVTKGGIKRRRANRNHILTKKGPKRKRHLRGLTQPSKNDENAVSRMLNNK